MFPRLSCTQKHMDVSMVIDRAAPHPNSDTIKIILNPPYQRDVVWETQQKMEFIDSIMRGINCHHVILNVDKNGDHICMDGKQRITSLVEFKKNIFPLTVVDENNVYINYYYDAIPNNRIVADKILSNENKRYFNNFTINIDEYNDLSLEQQIEIFSRIQKGKALTKGELVSAQFKTDNTMHKFNNYCESIGNLFTRFKYDIKRKEHYTLVIKCMYFIDKNTYTVTDKKTSDYIVSFNNMKNLEIIINKVDKLLKFCFNDEMFNHETITSKIPKNLLTIFIFAFYKLYGKTEYNEKIYSIYRSAIRKLYKEINECNVDKISKSKITVINIELIIKKLTAYITGLTKKQLADSFSDSDDDENDDNDDDNNNIVIPEKIGNKKMAKKIIKKPVTQIIKPKLIIEDSEDEIESEESESEEIIIEPIKQKKSNVKKIIQQPTKTINKGKK